MTGMRQFFAFLAIAAAVTCPPAVAHAQTADSEPQQPATQEDLDGLRSLGEPEAVPEEPQSGWQRFKSRLLDGGGLFGKKVTGPSGETVVRDASGQWRIVQRGADAAPGARAELEQAQLLFRQEQYSKAARAFKQIAKKYEKTSVAEDALFMRAESLFMMDKLPAAQDTYVELMVEFPTTRYLPQAVQRVYDIAYYWLEDSRLRSQGQPGKHYRITQAVNLFDRTRPMFDTNGRAIEAIEKIQQYDPLGPLSDDAGMMAAAHSFVKQDYIQAASYYEQVVADQPKSEHAPRAYLLGAQAYLRAYQGPNYDGRDLEDAERLTRYALAQSEQLSEEQRERLNNDLRVIYLERAKRDFTVAEEYRRMRRPKAAIYCYSLVVKKYPDTDWARRAQEEIHRLQSMPQSESRVPFFSSLFGSDDSELMMSTTAPMSSSGGQTKDAGGAENATESGQEDGDSRSIFSRLPFMSR